MPQNKTQPTDNAPETFLNTIKDEKKRQDSFLLLAMMKEITGEKPVLWGPGIIGFGKIHYKYESGREGDWFLTGFSPRAQNLSLYSMPGFKQYDALLQKLGKHTTGKSCLYIKKLDDVDTKVLKELIRLGAIHTKSLYPN